MEKNQVYIYFYCDEWKTYSSMSLVGVYNNFQKLINQIKQDVHEENIEVEDIDSLGKWNINEIEYGFVRIVTLNEKVN